MFQLLLGLALVFNKDEKPAIITVGGAILGAALARWPQNAAPTGGRALE